MVSILYLAGLLATAFGLLSLVYASGTFFDLTLVGIYIGVGLTLMAAGKAIHLLGLMQQSAKRQEEEMRKMGDLAEKIAARLKPAQQAD